MKYIKKIFALKYSYKCQNVTFLYIEFQGSCQEVAAAAAAGAGASPAEASSALC